VWGASGLANGAVMGVMMCGVEELGVEWVTLGPECYWCRFLRQWEYGLDAMKDHLESS
jgi:hypothetical protein